MKLRTVLFSTLLIFAPLTANAEQLNQEEFNKRVEMSLLISKILNDRLSEQKANQYNDAEETIKTLCFYKSTVKGILDLSIENIDLEGAIRIIKEAAAENKIIDEIFTSSGKTYAEFCEGYV